MKRCPKCTFPNMDTDHTCFKCGEKLDVADYLPETHPQADHYATAYINNLSNDSPSDVDKLSTPNSTLPEPDTAPPRPKIATRITPKYTVFPVLSILLRIIGITQGILLIALGIGSIFLIEGYLGLISLAGCILVGLISVVMSFIFSSLLALFNDIECNQRREIELMHHLYHKLNEKQKT